MLPVKKINKQTLEIKKANIKNVKMCIHVKM